MSAEALGEGVAPDFGRMIFVMSVLIGSAGVIFSYILLADLLGIFRKS